MVYYFPFVYFTFQAPFAGPSVLLKAPPKAGGSEERGGDGDYEAKIVSCFTDLCLAEEKVYWLSDYGIEL